MIIRSKAPLRLGLAGGGTDVSPYCDIYGGNVLNATIDLHAYCTIEITNDNKIVFNSIDKNERCEYETTNFIDYDGCLDLHKGVYNRVVKDFCSNNSLSFVLTTHSDAPAGSGLGSSSTVVVAILACFVEWLNLPLGEYDIAHLAFEIERIDLDMAGGKQDQYAATFGGFNFIEFYSDNRIIVNPLRIKDWVIHELEVSMLLYYTGISRESSKIINEQSNNAKNENRISIDAMHELKSDALEMKEAILKGDIVKFASYLGKSWEAKKRTASVISNSYLDNIYDVALGAGAYSGKVSGAGGGGFMMFIIDPVKKYSVIEALGKFDGYVVNFHFSDIGAVSWKI